MKVILKAGIIALVFIGAIMILLFLKGDSLSGKKIHKMIFLENAYDWQGCAVKSCRFEGNSVILLNASEPAELATQPISSGFPFDELILSWNASEPDSLEALEFNVEVSSDKKDWYNFAYQIWGAAIEGKWHNSGKVEYEGIGKMHTDYLVLDKPMNYARVNVRALGESGARDIELRRLSLSFSSKNSTWKQANINTEKAPSFECVKLA
ncbi:MAG TPA: hypothetical protein DCZ43_05975, partial [candidate division Zixibacteria bacterium]|nr:hypothetical protein [candidate division Zixibacteria bacterium]